MAHEIIIKKLEQIDRLLPTYREYITVIREYVVSHEVSEDEHAQ
jgi:hypothetical protein